MKSLVKDLLIKLSMADSTTQEFLEISKQVAEAVKSEIKDKLNKPPKEPKAPKPKMKKTVMCEDCVELFNNRIKDILP
jgi:hypothetical protein